MGSTMVILLKPTLSVGFKSAALLVTGFSFLLTTASGADPDSATSDSKLIDRHSDTAAAQPRLELTSPADAGVSISSKACPGCDRQHRGGFGARESYYRNGGVPLHRYDGGYSGGGYYGGGRAAGNMAVDYYRGVPGMRITEWPSTSTGLTLSEEQRMGLTSGVSVSRSVHQAGSCPLPLKKPYFNIPDYVW